MHAAARAVAVVVVVGGAAMAWWVLAAVMMARTEALEHSLRDDVAELWGEVLEQEAPTVEATRTWIEEEEQIVPGPDGQARFVEGRPITRRVQVERQATEALPIAASAIEVDLRYDPRRKGLIWFSLYDVAFDARYEVVNTGEDPRTLTLRFPFPQRDGYYDGFRFEVAGRAVEAVPSEGAAVATLEVGAGERVAFEVAYRSRGRGAWSYRPVPGWQAGEVRDLDMTLRTDFSDIDFPGRTLSPTTRERTADGWTLRWRSDRLVTGSGMGMVVPSRVQPGELAARLSLSAPLSLALFTVWVSAIAFRRGVRIHPMNHVFIAGAFFSFHLLFGYSADHLPVEAAFALSSAVSLLLTVTYLRLVAGPRFAVVQAGGAQLVYQVGFSLAHFWDGMTGLAVTVLLIATLFGLMQLTGRVSWEGVFSGEARA